MDIRKKDILKYFIDSLNILLIIIIIFLISIYNYIIYIKKCCQIYKQRLSYSKNKWNLNLNKLELYLLILLIFKFCLIQILQLKIVLKL